MGRAERHCSKRMAKRQASSLLLDLPNCSGGGGGPTPGVSPTLKFTFDDTNWMKASVSASLMKPRLHVSPSSSRRQRRPSVHVAQTFAEAAWRPWPSSWATSSSASWRLWVCPTSQEFIYTLRRFFFLISSSPRLLLLALALSCLSLIGIVVAFNSTLPSYNATSTPMNKPLKYTLVLLTLGALAILVKKAFARV